VLRLSGPTHAETDMYSTLAGLTPDTELTNRRSVLMVQESAE